jgi:hypothetical protein
MVELLKKIIHKSLGKLGSVQIVSAKHGISTPLEANPERTIKAARAQKLSGRKTDAVENEQLWSWC